MIWTAFPQLSHSIHPSVSSKLRDSFIAPQIGHFTSTEFNQNISHQLRKFVLEINNIVIENVKYTYQVYVEGMKNESLFNKEAQQTALQKCKQLCLGKFSDEMKNYIELNFGDIQNWLNDKIETTIYDLKNKGGNK